MRIFKKILKWIGIVIGGLLIIVFIAHTVLNIVWGRELRAKLAELKARGEPTTIAEIISAQVPDDENAATLLNKAFLLMTSGEGGKPYIPNKESGEVNKTVAIIEDAESSSDISKWTEKQRQEIPKLVNTSDMQRIYALLEQASKKPECNLNLNYEYGLFTLFPHLSKMRTSARLLSVKALIEAQSGNQDKALETYLTGLKIFKHLSNSPLVVPQLSLMGCDYLVMVSLQKMPCIEKVSLENYAKLILELESRIEPAFLTRFIQGERCYNLSVFQKYHDLKIENIIPGEKINISAFDKFTFYLWKPVLKRDMRANLEIHEELEKLYSTPYHKSINKFKKLENIEQYLEKKIPKYCILTRMMVPVEVRMYEKITSYKARIRVCATGLALKIYKQKHGNYPETLNELASYILKETHNDPFTGKDLVYQKTKDGFMLYSFGPNMKDDGGIPRFCGKAKTDADRKAEKDYDIIWKCEK